MSHHLEHFYKSDEEKKAFIPGCLALFFFLAIGTGFFIGLFFLVRWLS